MQTSHFQMRRRRAADLKLGCFRRDGSDLSGLPPRGDPVSMLVHGEFAPLPMVGVGERAAPTAGALAHGTMPPLRGTMVSGTGGQQPREPCGKTVL